MAQNGFKLTLDTLAPIGSISRDAKKEYVNSNFNLSINRGDAQKMKFWKDKIQEPTDVPAGLNWIDISEAKTTFDKFTDFTTADEEGVYYYHIVLRDSVNNDSEILSTGRIIYDQAAPQISDVWIIDTDQYEKESPRTDITNHTDNYFGFKYDNTGLAPVTSVVLTCDGCSSVEVKDPETPYDSYNSTDTDKKYFKFNKEVQGSRTVKFTLTDACGNTSTANYTIWLDTIPGDASIQLLTTAGETLPKNINFTEIKVKIGSSNSDIVGYKMWEGGETDEPANYITITKGKLDLTLDHTLASAQGAKILNVKIIDDADNTAQKATEPIIYDNVAPAVTIKADSVIIDNFSIANNDTTSTFEKNLITSKKLDLSYVEETSGMNSWDVILNNKSIKGEFTEDGDTSFPSYIIVTKDIGLVEGTNTLVVSVTDKAGNTGTATCHPFMDIRKPSITIGALSTWYNDWDSFSVDVTATDPAESAGFGVIRVWTSTTANDEKDYTGAGAISVTSGNKVTVDSTQITGSPNQSANNYIHVYAEDSVGHASIAHAKFGYDTVAPTSVVADFEKPAYASVNANVRVTSAQDATSGVKYISFTGDVDASENGAWKEIGILPTTVSLKLKANSNTGTSANKSVKVLLKDTAGNASGELAILTVELDESKPSAKLTLRNGADTTEQPASTSDAHFVAKISGGDDGETGKAVEYQLYGDFSYDSQSAAGVQYDEINGWKPLVYDTGRTEMTISNMYCTSNPADVLAKLKEINLRVRDNAGNISEVDKVGFTYDIAAPTVEVNSPDYDIVSKVHSLRMNKDGTGIANKYADNVNFDFTPKKLIQAYKVCAYIDMEDAKWKDAEQTQARVPSEEHAIVIGTDVEAAMRSRNLSATGLESQNLVSAMLRGLDFENAIKKRVPAFSTTVAYVPGKYVKYANKYYRCIADHAAGEWNESHFHEDLDGAHVIVIYVQDLGGTWSALANFTI